MIIEITEKYIEKGIGENTDFCPIALAIKDKTGFHVSVSPRLIHIYASREAAATYPVTQDVRDWIRAYDLWAYEFRTNSNRPQPITFNLGWQK